LAGGGGTRGKRGKRKKRKKRDEENRGIGELEMGPKYDLEEIRLGRTVCLKIFCA